MAHDPINAGYARALYALAEAETAVERIEAELLQLRDLLRDNPELLQFLKDPNVRREGKRQALAELFEKRIHSVLLSFLLTLSDQDRAGRLPAISEEFRALATAARTSVTGEVITAVPLDEATLQRLAEALGRSVGKNVRLLPKVDPAVLGGALLKVGDQVIDGTLRRKLDQLRAQLAL